MSENLACKNQQQLSVNKMRGAAQVAEKFGWSVGGYSTAYLLAEDFGLLTFVLVMYFSSSIQSFLVRRLDLELNTVLLRRSLLLRILSFICLSIACYSGKIFYLLLGAGFSGLFVGLFWPTFYSIKKQSVANWFIQEKIIGWLLCLVSGLIIVKWNPIPILIISTLAAILSYFWTFEIRDQTPKTNVLNKPSLDYNAMIAMSEGSLCSTIILTRMIVVISGSQVLFGLDGLVSFALIVSTTQLFGAFFSKWLVSSYTKIISCVSCSRICLIGIIITELSESLWIIGILIAGIGASALFPLTISIVRENLDYANIESKAFREDWRNRGRLIGATLVSVFWIYNIQGFSYIMLASLLVYLLSVFMAKISLQKGN